MFDWLRELYTIRLEYLESRWHCKSCETLRLELDRCNREKSALLTQFLTPKQEIIQKPPIISPPIRTRTPWPIKQQILEQEDREKAKVLAEFQKRQAVAAAPIKGESVIVTDPQIEELEKALGIDIAGEENADVSGKGSA